MENLVPYDLPLSVVLKSAGWKVKIREKETREPPHATIIRKTDAWRIDLRTGGFMDAHPNPKHIPDELLRIIDVHWMLLCQQWDAMYPDNPIADHEA